MKIDEKDKIRNELDFKYNRSKLVKFLIMHEIPYHLIPAFLRNLAGRFLAKKVSHRNFPIDTRIDQGAEKGKFMVALSHDVDTKYCVKEGISLLKSVEDKFKLKSTWNFVPNSNDYKLDYGLLRSLKNEGHEIGCHGYKHDGKFAFVSTFDREKRIKDGFEILKRFDVKGFRAPWLNRTRDMIKFVEKAGFKYDSSYPDTDPATLGYEGTGCGTVFPYYPIYEVNGKFVRSGVLEIPVTMPQDYTLLHSLGYSEEKMLELWKEKMDYIEKVGGVAVLLTHPSKYDLGVEKRLWVYEEILKYALSKKAFIGRLIDVYDKVKK